MLLLRQESCLLLAYGACLHDVSSFSEAHCGFCCTAYHGPACHCREDLQVGEEVQIMPCNSNHVYHPDCLAPWLKDHNSCPVCRFELPTDDMAYENQKERDQSEAEDRKGAANAVSHTDFLYT